MCIGFDTQRGVNPGNVSAFGFRDLRAKFDEDKNQPKSQKDGGKYHERRANILTITGPHLCSNRQSQHVGEKLWPVEGLRQNWHDTGRRK
uniref:Uncharacterized protein n=1 Tax=Lactuca sativa TaxID=4236 RepID=A0A9R1XXQ4_LACSA|nr:hypothetical protein LSAT_V11C100021800 [Lactuca sativa]